MDGNAKINLILELKDRLKTGFTKAKNTVNQSVGLMKDKIGAFKISAIQNIKAVAKEVPIIGRAYELIKNPIVLATAAILAFGAAGVNAAKWSNTWQNNMAKTNVTANLSAKELDKLSTKLIEIGTRNVAPLEEVPEAFNRIISAGLDVNTSLKVLEPTLRAAKAGFTDLETVAAAGVGVMNASGENINKVYDILFETLNKGNAEFKDIASYLPKIVPLAKGAGFALNETAGAWAFLTAQGQSAEQATTGMSNMVKAFSSVRTIKGMKGLGLDIYDAQGNIKPIVEIIGMLTTKMNGLNDAAKTKFLDQAGITDMEAKGAILSMTQNFETLKEVTDSVVNSQGALNEAYKNSKAPMDSWKILKNMFTGKIVKPFGDAILSVVSRIGDAIYKNIDDIWAVARNLAIAIGIVALSFNAVNIALGIAKVGMLIFNAITAINPISIVVIAVAALVTGITLLVRKTEGWAESWKAVKIIATTIFKQLGLNFQFYFQTIWFGIQWVWLKFKSLGQWLQGFFGNIGKAIALAFKGDFTGAKQALKAKITTQAGEEIKQLESEYKGKAQNFVNQTKANALAIQEASKMIGIRRKTQEEAEASTANAASGGNPLLPSGEGGTSPGGVPADSGIDKITGSAKQVKNIVINIDSFNKGGINTQNTNLQHMDATQLEQWFNDMMLRVIRNVELSY